MKKYKVTYRGNATNFKKFEHEISANSERGAVEATYALYLNSNYWPQKDGTILDCQGEVIAGPNDDVIEYDGGAFSADEINEEL